MRVLPQKVQYGLSCLFELARSPQDFVKAEQIAANRQLPEAYTQKVLQALASWGLVISQKGTGYRIGKPLNEISALSVVKALRGQPEAASGPTAILQKRLDDALAGVSLENLATTEEPTKEPTTEEPR